MIIDSLSQKEDQFTMLYHPVREVRPAHSPRVHSPIAMGWAVQ
jgi:hypothetical protein